MAHRKAASVSCAAVTRRVVASSPIISPIITHGAAPSSPSITGASRQRHAPSSTFSPPIARRYCTSVGLSYSSHYHYLSPCPSRLLATAKSRAISSTSRRSDDDSSTTAAAPTPDAAGADVDAAADDDPCPEWQNPLHHNNPDYDDAPVFAEDFAPGEEMPLVPLPPFEAEGEEGKVPAPPHVRALADEIVLLNMLEVKELLDRMADHFGFEDGDGGFGDEGGGEEEEEEAVVEEKVIFDLKLMAFEPKGKIKVIKEVRSVTSLGLKEAKELVEAAPTIVKKDIKMEEAEELKAKLEALGATVEIV